MVACSWQWACKNQEKWSTHMVTDLYHLMERWPLSNGIRLGLPAIIWLIDTKSPVAWGAPTTEPVLVVSCDYFLVAPYWQAQHMGIGHVAMSLGMPLIPSVAHFCKLWKPLWPNWWWRHKSFWEVGDRLLVWWRAGLEHVVTEPWNSWYCWMPGASFMIGRLEESL